MRSPLVRANIKEPAQLAAVITDSYGVPWEQLSRLAEAVAQRVAEMLIARAHEELELLTGVLEDHLDSYQGTWLE